MEDCLIAARLAGVSQLKYEVPGYGTATFDLKHEKAAGDREPVQAAERSFVERTAPRKEELTEEQKDARAAARRAKRPGRRRTRRRRLRRRLRARLSVRTTRTRSYARTSSS